MDLIKEKNDKVLFNKKHVFILLCIVVLMVIASLLSMGDESKRDFVDRDALLLSEVKQGSFKVNINGYGQLKTYRQKVLSTQREAMVEEVVHKSGAIVEPDTVIVRLVNPTLEQELLKAEQELAQANAQYRALILEQEKALIVEEGVYEKLKASHESAHLKLQALNDLLALGIVSKLDLKQAEITEKEVATQVNIQRNTIKKMVEMNKEHLKIEENKIEQFRISYQSARNMTNALTVRAGMKGVLQELNVELGQSLNPGEKIGIIGKTDDLIAMLKIPQAQAELIQIGQHAEIDTRKDKIRGEVSRIDPIVTEGTVSVEIKLLGQLPSSARPELNIDGSILVNHLDNVRFIKRPNNAKAMSDGQLYRLDKKERSGVLTDVRYGLQSGDYIEVRAGLALGDKVIVSGTSQFSDQQVLEIYN